MLSRPMDLAQVVNHPFLYQSAEESFRGRDGDRSVADRIVAASGKMVGSGSRHGLCLPLLLITHCWRPHGKRLLRCTCLYRVCVCAVAVRVSLVKGVAGENTSFGVTPQLSTTASCMVEQGVEFSYCWQNSSLGRYSCVNLELRP
jgi:hypothetical protein